jgi:hypothetical protein
LGIGFTFAARGTRRADGRDLRAKFRSVSPGVFATFGDAATFVPFDRDCGGRLAIRYLNTADERTDKSRYLEIMSIFSIVVRLSRGCLSISISQPLESEIQKSLFRLRG